MWRRIRAQGGGHSTASERQGKKTAAAAHPQRSLHRHKSEQESPALGERQPRPGLRAERPRQPNRAGPGPPWLRLRPQSNPAPPAPGIQVQPTGASGPRPAESTCEEPKPSTAPTCPRVHPSTCRVSREWSPGSVQRELRPQGQPDRCQTQTFCPEVRPQPPPAAKAMIGSTGSFFRKFKSKSTGRNRGLPEEPE